MKKVSICASMPMHSYQLGTSLVKYNILDKYYTSVYNNDSILYKLMKYFLPKNISKRVNNKKCKILDNYIKKYCEFEGLIFVGGGYVPIIKNYTDDIILHMNKRFGKVVGKDLISRNITAVVAYDTYAKDLFEYLLKKKSKIIKILDVASISSKIIDEIIEQECKKNYSFLDTMEAKKKMYSKAVVKNNICEIQLADYLLAGSNFAVNSLIATGVKKEKIKLVPYGVDTKQFSFIEKKLKNDTLIFLFVGRVEAAKGIWYLFEAFNDERIIKKNIKLRVIGDIRTNKRNLEKYKENISFEGMKQYQEMSKIYEESDIYILSSLWEGFSFSLLEAMASGLPSIATKASAGPEVISNYQDGILINSANTEEIIQAVLWFENHRSDIPSMSKKAREKIISNYTLEHYYERVYNAMKEILD